MYYYIYNYNIQYTADTFTKFIPNYKKNEITQSSGSTKKYKEIKELGSGGYGKVILVSQGNEYYALKKIDIREKSEEYINNCYNEINILKSLKKNDKIVKYHDYYKENGYLNIIMEYGGDMNLDKFIKNQKSGIEEKIIKEIFLQICNGLRVIHEAKIIHRDLTPANIFINTNNYSIKIGDFGISTKLETNKNSAYTKNRRGAEYYIAPELETGNSFNNKVDIFSLGCILYELFFLRKYKYDKLYGDVRKIDIDLYNKNWQNLIDLLLKTESSERPDIKDVIQHISYIK